MKLAIWKKEVGYTFAVLFANGTSGAEYVAINPKTGEKFSNNWTKAAATKASEKFRDAKGDGWERGNLHYRKSNPETGEEIPLFRHVNFAD